MRRPLPRAPRPGLLLTGRADGTLFAYVFETSNPQVLQVLHLSRWSGSAWEEIAPPAGYHLTEPVAIDGGRLAASALDDNGVAGLALFDGSRWTEQDLLMTSGAPSPVASALVHENEIWALMGDQFYVHSGTQWQRRSLIVDGTIGNGLELIPFRGGIGIPNTEYQPGDPPGFTFRVYPLHSDGSLGDAVDVAHMDCPGPLAIYCANGTYTGNHLDDGAFIFIRDGSVHANAHP